MATPWIERTEFEGYIRRHESDEFAHAKMRQTVARELGIEATMVDSRLTALERWQQRMIGALIFLTVAISGGGLTVVIELARR